MCLALRTIGVYHSHNMCEASTHQLKMRRKGHCGYNKEDCKILKANHWEEKIYLTAAEEGFSS